MTPYGVNKNNASKIVVSHVPADGLVPLVRRISVCRGWPISNHTYDLMGHFHLFRLHLAVCKHEIKFVLSCLFLRKTCNICRQRMPDVVAFESQCYMCQWPGTDWHQSISKLLIHSWAAPRGMMTSSNGNILRVTGPLCEEFTGHHRWIPLTKASDAELWCFLWSAPQQTVE